MIKAPERIHLDGDSEAGRGMFPRCFENPKYCSEPAIEYIRADLVAALEAEVDRLRAEADKSLSLPNLTRREWYAGMALAGVTSDPACQMTPSELSDWCLTVAENMASKLEGRSVEIKPGYFDR